MPMIANSAIIASAGTGKTFRLAKRYIKLLSLGVRPSEIVALTFTKAAAHEMLQRILLDLVNAVLCEKNLRELYVSAELDGVPSKEDCEKWLALLIKELPFAKVSTYDSFFYKLLRCFAFDLGLDPSVEILDEKFQNQLLKDALNELLVLKSRKPASLFYLLSSLSEDKELRHVSKTVLEELGRLGKQSLSIPPETVAKIRLSSPVSSCDLKELHTSLPKKESVLKTLFDAISKAASTGKCSDLTNKNSQVKNLLKYGKPDWSAIDGLMLTEESLEDLKNMLRYLGTREIMKKCGETTAAYELARDYQKVLLALKFERNIFTFSDVSLAVSKLLAIPEIGLDVYFRLNAGISHFLIDEFQDTSWQQWKIMHPLVGEAVSDEEKSLFVVGDVKQSIYSWRGSSPEIFNKFLERYSDGFEIERLSTSYRSVPDILTMVNRVFALPCFTKWASDVDYSEHVSAIDGSGFASISFVDDAKDIFEAAVKPLEEVEPWKHGLSSAVLCRKNDQVEAVLALLKERGIPCASSSNVTIKDYPETRIMLAFLRCLSDPGDTLSLFVLRNSPLKALFSEDNLEETLSSWRRRLLSDGVFETVSRLLAAWKEDADPAEARSVSRNLSDFMLAIAAYKGHPNNLEDLIDYIETYEHPREKSDTGKVIVSTIHTAKGLTYDMVVVPVKDLPLRELKTGSYLRGEITSKDLERPQVSTFIKKCNKIAYFASEEYYDLEKELLDKNCLENCNLFYVALTRAAKALYIVCNKSNSENMINSQLQELEGSVGKSDWYKKEQSGKPDSEQTETFLSPAFNSSMTRRRQVISPSKLGEKEREEEISDEMPFVAKERDEAMRRGSAIHAYCENILWLDERADTSSEENVEAKAVVDAYIARHHENVFVKPTEECEVRREMPFMALVDDKLVKGIMDRVHFFPSAQAPERIVVYDFKTGHPHEENQVQIDLYVKVLKDIFNLENITGELVYLEK